MDVYTPSLPRIRSELGGADWVIQASITACLFGIGAGQLVFGPLSDRIGRRTVILVGTVGWTVASILSSLVVDPGTLVLARLAAGLFGSAGIVVARSVVRDVSDSPRSIGVRIGVLAMVSAAAPVVAPTLGAAIAAVWGWRADFVFLAVLGAIVTGAVLRLVPESLPPAARAGKLALAGGLAVALHDRELRGLALALGIQAFGFYAYIATASFVVERQLGYGPGTFAAVFGTNAAAMLAANLAFRRLVRSRHPSVMLGIGLSAALLGGVLLAASAALDGPDWSLWAASTVFAASMGFVLPSAHSWGQLTSPPSGAASALTGSAQFLGGVLGSPVTGLIGPTALTLGIIIAASSALALPAWRVARGARSVSGA
jgi:MFS transporter, DHA1 family, multidrug resistance protein